jgi:hypothetical protein
MIMQGDASATLISQEFAHLIQTVGTWSNGKPPASLSPAFKPKPKIH